MRRLKFTFLLIFGFSVLFFIWTNTARSSLWKKIYKIDHEYVAKYKYILQWTSRDSVPFVDMGQGRKTFIERKCSANNCYVTSLKSYFNNITKFDVIVFHGPDIVDIEVDIPQIRSPHQKYVFVSMESSDHYPICHNKFNGIFNWTWTYKLNSNVPYQYITIRNKNGEIIGPKENMQWIKVENMKPINNKLREKLQSKTKVAAWFVSNCKAYSGRQFYVKRLQKALRVYGLAIDVYGYCGNFTCPRKNMTHCLEIIERDYYFYLSFENSFSEDYVTEKLLHALQNYAIPVVFGGANYTRFMPDGIYIDAKVLGVNQLAKQMNDIIKNKEMFYNYFKWHNHYFYHYPGEYSDSDHYCQFCTKINNETLMKEVTVKEDIENWWTIPWKC